MVKESLTVAKSGRISSTSADDAKARAEEIRNQPGAGSDIPPCTVIGGDPKNWFYYFVPNNNNRPRLVARLKSLGYDPAPGVELAGLYGGDVWRLPIEIRLEQLEHRRKKLIKRNQNLY